MRCLHCNKKLSLLKLAKGDDYCSPEHFDAHQLQLSKTAIARLMGTPAEESPKRPLVFTPREDDAKAALPRVADLPPASVPQEIHQASPLQAQETPPYAPFALSPLTVRLPKAVAPVAKEPGHDEPAASAGELSFPVHEWEATTCLLNLYARLGLSEMTPLNWTSPRNFILAAEGFPREVERGPELTLKALNLADFTPDDSAVPRIASAVEETASPVEPEELAWPPLPFLIAPSFRERAAQPFTLEPDSSNPNPTALAPVAGAALPRSDSPDGMAWLTRFAEASWLGVQNSTDHWVRGSAELPIAGVPMLPAAEKKVQRDRWHTLNRQIKIRGNVLESGRQTTCPIDFAPPAGASLLVRPATGVVRPGRLLEGQAPVYRAISPVSGSFAFTNETPRPAAASAAPIALAAREPQKRAIKTVSRFRAPRETRPSAQESRFRAPSVAAMEFGWRAVLAKTLPAEPLSPAPWHRQVHYALQAAIADGPAQPTVPMPFLPYEPASIQQGPAQLDSPSLAAQTYYTAAWSAIDAAMPHTRSPAESRALPEMRFSAIQCSTTPKMSTNSAAILAFAGPFAAVSSTVFTPLDSHFASSTNFPQAAKAISSLRFGMCTHCVSWQPRLPVDFTPPPVKFLPHRENPILPSAVSWAQLRSLPR